MRARRMVTTGLAGSTVESLSELVRGSAAGLDSGRDSDLVDLDLGGRDLDDRDLADVPDSGAGRDLVVGRESADADRLAVDSTVVAFTGAVDFTAAVASTVAVVRTAEAVTAADTGKSQQ
ncbi:MAG TPA: hypothetical protein VN884_02815 [Candidatus Sulfotelmatobacter sp.]|nr:hypothetical protein [Candidatus Sulfotelmatobacter sp.]